MRASKKISAIEYEYGIRKVTRSGFLWCDRAPDSVCDHSLHITDLKPGDRITKFVMMLDETDGVSSGAAATRRFKTLAARSYSQLRAEHVKMWREYSGKSSVQIPDKALQYLFDLSVYVSKAH